MLAYRFDRMERAKGEPMSLATRKADVIAPSCKPSPRYAPAW